MQASTSLNLEENISVRKYIEQCPMECRDQSEIALLLFDFALQLVQKSRIILPTNKMQNIKKNSLIDRLRCPFLQQFAYFNFDFSLANDTVRLWSPRFLFFFLPINVFSSKIQILRQFVFPGYHCICACRCQEGTHCGTCTDNFLQNFYKSGRSCHCWFHTRLYLLSI